MVTSSGEKKKSKHSHGLELKQGVTDTDQEFSELSPSSVGEAEVVTSVPKWKSVKLIVVGARKLEKNGMFGKADPYVLLSYREKTTQSKTVKNNLNPEWNFEQTLDVDEASEEEITIEVYDKDTVSKDDFMGRATISVGDLPKLKHGQWIPLQGCKSGEVFVSSGDPTEETILDQKKQTPVSEPSSPQKSQSSKPNSNKASPEKQLVKKVSYEADSIGKVSITVVKAADLKKKSDPYAVISSRKETFKTKTIKKTQEPEWNHNFEMSMLSKEPGEVKIEVFNKKTLGKDELLGFVVLPTKDLLQPPHSINSWFKLEGAKSGQIFIAGGYLPRRGSKEGKQHSC